MANGPLTGIRVLEFAGLGPAPFAGMLLADLGADVVLVDRPSPSVSSEQARFQVNHRGKRSLLLDLKTDAGRARALAMAGQADVVIEGFRPGVMERLGLGPDTLLAQQPRLVYGRMTGWGQSGPLAQSAGHDINYISLSGALDAFGRRGEAPVPPLNLVGDFGGGALYLVMGVLAALLHARGGGGQVVDAAMVDGSASLLTMLHGMIAAGQWTGARGENLLDTGRPWYEVYRTQDGRHVSIGALEPAFYAQLLALTGLDGDAVPSRDDPANWPALHAAFTRLFLQRTQAEWQALLEGTDACFAPVLSARDAPHHPHLAARGTYGEIAGVVQAMPAPRFSGTPAQISRPPPAPGEGGEQALRDWGIAQP
jgi:alpha-methylacyl-CoA racemase